MNRSFLVLFFKKEHFVFFCLWYVDLAVAA